MRGCVLLLETLRTEESLLQESQEELNDVRMQLDAKRMERTDMQSMHEVRAPSLPQRNCS